jgi:3,4-dihydroxy 2-butanone 4-phosphate synthase/GTP cyclohydrolase II
MTALDAYNKWLIYAHSGVGSEPFLEVELNVPKRLSNIESAVEAIRRGEIVVVMDAEDRENEGDFICAAEKVTPEIINFMLNGRGQLCVSLLPDTCRRLNLYPIVGDNTTPLRTNFTVPVDHRTVRTGITAAERASTILALIDPASQPDDFLRPGHVSPLIAKEGGVLRRAGHTEAAVDLARMAGLVPAGVLCEVLADSGQRATSDELHDLSRRHGLQMITIEQLIQHRRKSEKLVYRAAEANLPTHFGPGRIIVYGVRYEEQEAIAIVLGNPDYSAAPLVRLHSSCFTGDLIGSLRCDCGDQLQMAMQMMSAEGGGIVVYLPQEGRGIGLVEKIKAYHLQDQGMDTVEANLALGHQVDSRDYGVGIQVLKDLGISRVRLLTNNPKKTDAFIYGGFELEVVDQVPIIGPVHKHNARYLAVKRDKMGHKLP